ncbi:MAG: YkgJ family cysteine cluster protein [Candidatus Helarchaeota archaeon]
MVQEMAILTDGAGTNTLLEFISTYFPFIDEPIILRYRKKTYKVVSTMARQIRFEDFFVSHDCLKCTMNCCKEMYIPLGFAPYWSEEKLERFKEFKPRRYRVWLNGKEYVYYIGTSGARCKYQEGKACTIWDSNQPVQIRPMGCHFYPMTWYWWKDTIIFTKHCEPYICKGESTRYTQQDFERDMNTFQKLCREIESIGLSTNYRPLEALKEAVYFSI